MLIATIELNSQTAVWGDKFSGSNSDVSTSVITDKDGNIYLVGNFWSTTLNFNNGKSVTNSGSINGFIAKFDKDSICQWATSINSTSQATTSKIVVDGNKNIFIAGTFRNVNVTFNNGKFLPITLNSDSYLAKYDSNGVCQWAESISGDFNDYANNLAFDNYGNIYVAGSFNSITLTFNNGISVSNGSQFECFLAKYTSSGLCDWALTFDGDIDDFLTGMVADSIGNLYLTGYFRSEELVFNNGISIENTTMDYEDIFVTKYNSSGVCQWATRLSGTGTDFSGGIDVDSFGNIYLSGYFNSDTLRFNNNKELTGYSGNNNIYLAKFNNSGACQWAEKIIGASISNQASLVSVDNYGSPIIGGYFDSQSLDFNNGISLSEVGNQDAFFAKYDKNGRCEWAELVGSSEYDELAAITIDNSNYIIIAGHSEGNSLALNNNITIQGGQSIWGFFAKYSNPHFIDNSPSISTNSISEITKTSAKTGITFTYQGNKDILSKGLVWSDETNPKIDDPNDAKYTGTPDSADFEYTITGLSKNTEYFARAFVVIDSDTIYGNEQNFTTLNDTLPIINTTNITSITKISASSGGTFTVKGNVDILQKGVCWSTLQNPTVTDDFTDNGSDSTDFNSNLTQLVVNTTYYVRAYVIIENDTIYGNEISFSTLNKEYPSISTFVPYQTTKNSSTSGGIFINQGDYEIIQKGVCWGINLNPTLNDSFTNDGMDSTNYASYLTGLTPETEYWVRAYVIIENDTIFGNNYNFITGNYDNPVIMTSNITNLTYNSATSGGVFTQEGDLPILQKGVCWSTIQNPTINDNFTNEGADSSNYVSQLSNLIDDTNYFVRAYATTQKGTFYGNEITFKTDTIINPQITTAPISNIKINFAISGGVFDVVGDLPIIQKGLCWATNTIPTISSYKTEIGSGSLDFTDTIRTIPLCNSQKYLVRAYAITQNGVLYGDTVSFNSISHNVDFHPEYALNFYSDSLLNLNKIAIDKNSNIYAYGTALGNDSIYLNNNKNLKLTPLKENDFIAKLDTNGNAQWIRKTNVVTNGVPDTERHLKIDSSNNFIISTNYSAIPPSFWGWKTAGYLAKYNSSGNLIWETSIKGNYVDQNFIGGDVVLKDFVVDSENNIYVVGNIKEVDTIFFNNNISYLLNYFIRYFYVAKYDSNGICQWANVSVADSTEFYKLSLGIDSKDSIFLASTIFTLDLKYKITLQNISHYDGNLNWRNSYTSDFYTEIHDLEIDNSDNIYISGYYPRSVQGLNLTNPFWGHNVSYIAKFSNNGNVQWANNISTGNYESHNQLTKDNNGDIFICSSGDSLAFTQSSCGNFTPGDYSNNPNPFLLKILSDGKFDVITQLKGDSTDQITSIAFHKNSLYASGFTLSDTLDFNSGIKLFKKDTQDGFLAKFNIGIDTPDTLNIPLATGWNLISSFIIPDESSMDSVFQDIANEVLIVKNGKGKIFVPSYQINTIGDWNMQHGYQVYSTTNTNLQIIGIPVEPESTNISLNAGWNIISYLRSTELSSPTGFASITDNSNLLMAKDSKGKIYVPSYNINTIGNLKPGDGYQIFVVQADTLIYPSE